MIRKLPAKQLFLCVLVSLGIALLMPIITSDIYVPMEGKANVVDARRANELGSAGNARIIVPAMRKARDLERVTYFFGDTNLVGMYFIQVASWALPLLVATVVVSYLGDRRATTT